MRIQPKKYRRTSTHDTFTFFFAFEMDNGKGKTLVCLVHKDGCRRVLQDRANRERMRHIEFNENEDVPDSFDVYDNQNSRVLKVARQLTQTARATWTGLKSNQKASICKLSKLEDCFVPQPPELPQVQHLPQLPPLPQNESCHMLAKAVAHALTGRDEPCEWAACMDKLVSFMGRQERVGAPEGQDYCDVCLVALDMVYRRHNTQVLSSLCNVIFSCV